MKILKYMCIAAMVCSLAACKKDELPTYKQGDADATSIYFAFGNETANAQDSMRMSMVREGIVVADSIAEFKVMIMGRPVGYDRKIAFTSEGHTWQVPEVDAETGEQVLDPETGKPVMAENKPGDAIPLVAVEGRDYELLDSHIPADSVWGVVRVKLLSSPELIEASYDGMSFRLKLQPNDYFNTNYTALNDKSVAKDDKRKAFGMTSTSYKLTFEAGTESSRLWELSTWSSRNAVVYFNGAPRGGSSWVDWFGDYSVKKIQLIVEATGEPWAFWHPKAEEIPTVMGTFMQKYWQKYVATGQAYARSINRAIAKMTAENNGTPPVDERGRVLELGPAGKAIK